MNPEFLMVHTNKPISGDIGVIGDGLLLGLPGSKIIIFPPPIPGKILGFHVEPSFETQSSITIYDELSINYPISIYIIYIYLPSQSNLSISIYSINSINSIYSISLPVCTAKFLLSPRTEPKMSAPAMRRRRRTATRRFAGFRGLLKWGWYSQIIVVNK